MAALTRQDELAAHYAFCGAELRKRDRDLWLSALYAPAALRQRTHAIYAFACEIEDIPSKVTQSLLGEMRLRWWTDALETTDGAQAHPIADALRDTIAASALDRSEFSDFLEAWSAELYDEPLDSVPALMEHCRRTMAPPLLWAARALGASESDQARAAMENAGVAKGLVRILREDAAGASRRPPVGQSRDSLLALAAERFEEARRLAPALDGPTRIALLATAALPLDLAALRGERAAPSPWRRQWRLWRAARRGL